MTNATLEVPRPRTLPVVGIATLGPGGTSSESAARRLAAGLTEQGATEVVVELHPSYESAHQALVSGGSDLLLVANAYSDISQFYMDPRLRLATAFVHVTPLYGIAARAGTALEGRLRVATHPAPSPIVRQLLPAHLPSPEIVHSLSTSAAARAAAVGEVDVALTTEHAAQLHGLEFVTRTRTIEMLWSVFCAENGPVGRYLEETTWPERLVEGMR